MHETAGWNEWSGCAGQQFVAVYLPRNLRTVKTHGVLRSRLNEQDLVVASARGNLEPLLALATQRLQGQRPLIRRRQAPVPKTELDRCQ